MRVGYLLLADEVRVHELDATIDVVRGGQAIVAVDPTRPRLDRTVALEMVCEFGTARPERSGFSPRHPGP